MCVHVHFHVHVRMCVCVSVSECALTHMRWRVRHCNALQVLDEHAEAGKTTHIILDDVRRTHSLLLPSPPPSSGISTVLLTWAIGDDMVWGDLPHCRDAVGRATGSATR